MRRFLTALLLCASCLSARADVVLPPVRSDGTFLYFRGNPPGVWKPERMPAFTGGDCASSSGTVVITCTPFARLGSNNVFTGKQTLAASGSGGAGLNLPPGAAPTSPVDGDIWTTSSGLFVRANGVTIGPLVSVSGIQTAAPNALSFNNLKIAPGGTPASQVTVTADRLTLPGAGTSGQSRTAVSNTCSTGTTGANGLDSGSVAANTWYAVFEIDNGTTPACLLSTSATAPSLPSGYTYSARVGWVRTNASSQLIGVRQYGKSLQLVVDGTRLAGTPVAATNLGTSSFVLTSLASFVPSTASGVRLLVVGGTSGSNGAAGAAPNSGYGSIGDSTNPPPCAVPANLVSQTQCVIQFETAQTIWAYAGLNGYVRVIGWEDNL